MLLTPVTPGTGNKAMAAGSNGPLLLATMPADGATGVSTNTKLRLTFDESVQKGTGSAAVTIRKVIDNTVVESYVTATNTTNVSISSNVVTITPSSNKLQPNTAYYVTIDPGAFRNASGVDYAGLTDGTAWRFTTGAADTTPPALMTYSTQVQVGEPIVLHFSEPVFAAVGSIQIVNTADNTDVRSIPVIDVQVSGAGTEDISILPSIPLRGGASYRIIIPNTAFADAAGNKFAGTTATTGPLVGVIGSSLQHESFTPANGATGIPTATNTLTITFNKNVEKGSGTKKITVKNLITNQVAHDINVNSGSVTVSGKNVTIQLTGGLQANTSYYVMIDPGAFVEQGNPSVLYAGITDAVTWNFTTMAGTDITKPTIIQLTPPDNSVNGSLSQTLRIQFSEPVYPGSGDIVIRNLNSDAVFDTIPVTSNRVTGFGTNTISFQVASAFVVNQSYYVNISPQAFRDAAGNFFEGITNKTTWNFSISRDNTPPTIASMTPVAGLNSVPVNQVFKLTFSEPVRFADGSPYSDQIVIRGTKSSTSPVATRAEIDTDGKTLLITPWNYSLNQQVDLQQSTSYYIEIPANLITDMAGNPFGGILNEYTWTFGTIGSDKTAPSIQSAAVSGSNRIILTYNEPLDETKIPPTGSFYITANDVRLNVTGVTISGQSVILTLQTGVVFGQTIKLYYTRSNPAIQDLSGNLAANLTNYSVKNEAGATLPVPTGASVSGNILTITFNSSLQTVNANAYSQFRVRIGGNTVTPTGITGSSSTITLVLPSAVTGGQNVYVSYTPGSYPLRDTVGNAVGSFSNFPVTNALDTTPPSLQSASVSDNLLTLTYNEPLDTGSIPKTNQFGVTVDNSVWAVNSVSVNGSSVVLTLASAVTSGQTVRVSYYGGTPAIRDVSGNSASAFTNYSVSNVSSSLMPVSGSVSGRVITIYFGQTLSSGNIPQTSQFGVQENGSVKPVSSVAVSGSSLMLTLSADVSAGSVVTVSYQPPSTASRRLQTASGVPIPAFSGFIVSHGSSGGSGVSGSYEAAPGGGINIRTTAAATESRMSSGGRAVMRYKLSADTIAEAYQRANSAGSRRVTFTVPETQAAANVELPVGAVLDTRNRYSDAAFAVVYDDVIYEIPLDALDQRMLLDWRQRYSQGGLLIEIDTGNASNARDLQNAVSRKGYTLVSGPFAFTLSLTGTERTEPIPKLSKYITRTIIVPASINTAQHAVVRLDPQTGEVAHVPAIMTTEGSRTTVAFKHDANTAFALIRNLASFSDIPSNHWARADLQLMTNRLIAMGRTNTTFAPNQPITRAEFAEYIVRGLGLEGDKSQAIRFRDVPQTSDVAAYIGAAYKANIIAGVADDRFAPDNLITREEMAAMMVRAARAAGVEILLVRTQSEYIAPFTDRNTLSAWARSDMARAIEAKIIGGMANNQLGPKKNATRAEAVVMIKRLLQYVKMM